MINLWKTKKTIYTQSAGWCYLIPVLILTLELLHAIFVPAYAADKINTKKVLVLYAGHRGLPWHEGVHQALTEFFPKKSKIEVTLDVEHLDALRNPGRDYIREMHVLFDKKYAGLKFDLIIAIDPASVEFATEARKRLFGPTPVVFGVVQSDYQSIKHLANITGIVLKGKNNYQNTLELALRLHPETRRVVMVGGNDEMSLNRLEKAKAELAPYGNRLELRWLTDLPMDTILSKLKHLPENTIVFYIFFLRDSSGNKFIPRKACELIAKSSNKPVYGFWDMLIGTGIVGGQMDSSQVFGTQIAELGLRILQNKDIGDIPMIEDENIYIFDWNQLQRWKINESDLPPGSRVEFRTINFFDKYKKYIISGIALCIIELILIFFLVINRAKLLRVEMELEENSDNLEALVLKRTDELLGANEALKESEDRFRSLSEASSEGIVITEKGSVLEVNNNMCKMFGYSISEFTGMEAVELVSPEDREHVKNKILTDYELVYESNCQRKDNSIFPVEVHAKLFIYKGQKVRVTALRDITMRKQAEETLKESELLYRALFKKNISQILLIDVETAEIVDANPSACSYYGYSKKKLTSMKISDLNILSKEEIYNEMKKAQSEQRNYFNFRHRLADSSIRDIEVFSGPIKVKGRELLCSIIHDISERKASEKERERLIGELQKALEEIKTLKGIVPICSNCKKIRDDKGYWNLLESYIEQYSEASFSHGICPDCSDELYGKESWYIKMKKEKND